MEKKMVRPYMTAEARDVLDKIHEHVDGETRSESIEWFWIRHANLLSQRDGLKSELGLVREKLNLTESTSLTTERAAHAHELNKERKKNKEWKVYCAVLACTTIASLVALAIQAA